MVEPEEVDMLVSPPNLAFRNKMQGKRELLGIGKEDTDDTIMRKKLHSSTLWQPEIATWFDLMMTTDGEKIAPPCQVFSNSRSYPKTRALAAIPAGTVFGPVLEVHFVKIHDGYGI